MQGTALDNVNKIHLPSVVGKGYREFWNFRGRYLVLKGGRGSKKSTTVALRFIYNMMHYYHAYGQKPHLLAIRRFYNTNKDSTYAQLKWAINRLGVSHLWKYTISPLELTYKPSGQKIMFRGMDNPQSISSITVDDGHLCWVWWEEAFQIPNEDDFDKVDMSIRGEIPAPLFKQHVISFNPWNEKIWLKKRFFDSVGIDGYSKDGNILSLTRNFDCNEFLGEDDRYIFEQMRLNSPRRFDIEGLGNWGISEGLIFSNWRVADFDIDLMRSKKDKFGIPALRKMFGCDWGWVDPFAFVALLADEKEKKLYIYDEIYESYLSNQNIYDKIKAKGYAGERIIADSAYPQTISELTTLGTHRMTGAKKGAGSVLSGIQKLQDYELIIHPNCPNMEIELSNYAWATDRETGKTLEEPIDEWNHLIDATRYATEELNSWKFSF